MLWWLQNFELKIFAQVLTVNGNIYFIEVFISHLVVLGEFIYFFQTFFSHCRVIETQQKLKPFQMSKQNNVVQSQITAFIK